MDNQAERMYQLMRVESNRLKTFQMNPPWPKDYVDIKKLAKAGFFYAFNGDNVHCAFCRGQVCRWERDDDPMSEHARHFTTCPFIMGSEVGNEPLGEDPFPGPKRPRPYDVCGMMFPTFPPNDPRSQQEQLEPQQHSQDVQLQHGSDNHFEQYQYDYDRNNRQNEQTTANANVQQQQAPDENNHMPPYDDENNTTASTGTTEENLNHQARHSLSSNSSNCSSSSTSLTGICKICYSNPIELLFLPCQHSVSCLSCAQRLHSCPCCRAFIRTKIRSFLV